jgi:methionyl-tRNA formyltransferase
VKAVAAEFEIPVSHRIADALDADAVLGVVVAFGRIIPAAVLEELPMVNLHMSLLPRWRGAAPIERAILAGDAETGVSLMALEEGLDTGPVYAVIRVPIDDAEHADELTIRLGEIGTTALLERLGAATADLGEALPQLGEVTYAEKLTIDDHHLDFFKSAVECLRVVRIGRAWTTFRGKRLIVHAARIGETTSGVELGALVAGLVATGDGSVILEVVQLEGRSAQPYDQFANGVHVTAGERLG